MSPMSPSSSPSLRKSALGKGSVTSQRRKVDSPIGTEKEIKLTNVKQIGSQIDEIWRKVVAFSKDRETEVRLEAIEAVRKFSPLERQECLYEALLDPDKFIRISGLEGLEALHTKLNQTKICALLEDKEALVRGTAAICLANIAASGMKEILQKKIDRSVDEEEKVAYLFSLCKLGNMEFFIPFVNYLFHSFYRIRCAVANLVVDIVNESNVEFLLNLLFLQRAREDSIAAKSSIDWAIQRIKGDWPLTKLGRKLRKSELKNRPITRRERKNGRA